MISIAINWPLKGESRGGAGFRELIRPGMADIVGFKD